MNGATREQIMTALLARLQTQCGTTFKTYSRAFIMWEQLVQLIGTNSPAVPAFPALFTFEGMGFPSGGITDWTVKQRGTPGIRTLDVTIVLYARKAGAGTPSGIAGDPVNNPGSSVLNPLIEAVESAMQPDNKVSNLLQLGNPPLVYHCWIEGKGAMVPGDLDPCGLGMQTVPVRIMIP